MYSPFFLNVQDEPLLETTLPIPQSVPLSKTLSAKKRDHYSLMKSQSNSAFGEVFSTKNKTASKKFTKSCLVTVHDYGPTRYEINGQFISQGGGEKMRQFSKEQRFSDPEGLLAGLPVLGTEKPEWANVRFVMSYVIKGFHSIILSIFTKLRIK